MMHTRCSQCKIVDRSVKYCFDGNKYCATCRPENDEIDIRETLVAVFNHLQEATLAPEEKVSICNRTIASAMMAYEEVKERYRCQGYRRRGRSFSIGPVVWEQCNNIGVVMLEARNPGEPSSTYPACERCWQECLDTPGITVMNVMPLGRGDK